MAIEHSCHRCGEALGALPAPRDPRLGLCVVVCPVCRTACVRRRHPLVSAWRTFVKVLAGVYGIAWRVVVALVLVNGSFIITMHVRESLAGLSPMELVSHLAGAEDFAPEVERWREDHGPPRAVFLVCWFIAMGAVASGGLAHERARWKVWVVLFGLPWVFMGLDILGHVIDRDPAAIARGSWIDARYAAALSFGAKVQVFGLACAMLGIPIGRALRRGAERRERRRWIKRLARARVRRSHS